MSLTDEVRRRRREHAWTQPQLADRVGISVAALGRIERGTAEPRPSTLAKLAAALECEPRDLLRETP